MQMLKINNEDLTKRKKRNKKNFKKNLDNNS